MTEKRIAGARAMERAIEIVQWMDAQRTPITWQRMRDRFDISRATAYRWMAVYNDRRIRPDSPQEHVDAG